VTDETSRSQEMGRNLKTATENTFSKIHYLLCSLVINA
jgi:hypothetical protein